MAHPDHEERMDTLDQQWMRLLQDSRLLAVPFPNCIDLSLSLLKKLPIEGVLLTGGNDLTGCQGDAPERDEVETKLLDFALKHRLPVLGVCRGMQLIQIRYGVNLYPVDGHVARQQLIQVGGDNEKINSFHRWGTRDTVPQLIVWAKAMDGVIKAVRHQTKPIMGIMWHPERFTPFRRQDIKLIHNFFYRNQYKTKGSDELHLNSYNNNFVCQP